MKHLKPSYFDSWGEADAAFASFIAELPKRRGQLRGRLAQTDGSGLDGSVESQDALNEWYIRIAFADEDDGMDWRPGWRSTWETWLFLRLTMRTGFAGAAKAAATEILRGS